MNRWIALLRGVNVGGGNVIKMADLRESLTARGAASVTTYIQSGNIVFDVDAADRTDATGFVATALAEDFDLSPSIIVLTVDELDDAVDAVPFDLDAAEPKLVHLFFGNTPIDPTEVDTLRGFADDADELVADDRVLYVHTPGGFGRSRVGDKIAGTISVGVTGRNLRSARKILELARS